MRLDLMAKIEDLFQNGVDLLWIESFGRQYGCSVFFFDSNHNISAANIVNIIRKTTNGFDDWNRIKIFFKFDSIGFDDMILK